MISNSLFENYSKNKLFSCLDGLRCASITYVIWHHTTEGNTLPLPLFHRGFLGVDLFFIISGFLIATLLMREVDKTGDISLTRFYIRRVLRIFPIYYTLLLAISCVILFLKPGASMRGPFFADLPYYVSYTSNWHHNETFMAISWSLATEEQFYLLWPFIQKKFKSVAIYLLLFILGVNQAINFGALPLVMSPEQAQFFESLEIIQCTFTPICLGVLLAYALHYSQSFNFFAWMGKKWSPLWAFVAVLITLNLPGEDIQGWIRLLFQLAGTVWVGTLVIREKNLFQKIMTFYPFVRIGIVSYGMYLFHLIIKIGVAYALMTTGISSRSLLFLGTLVFTYLFCELSYRYYETPFLNMKKRFES
jgi:peptidoglycan/LPS O-acetylase OafA/YrhL